MQKVYILIPDDEDPDDMEEQIQVALDDASINYLDIISEKNYQE